MYLSPLDPSSSIPNSSSVPQKPRMMIQKCENGFKLRKLNDDVGKDNAQENKLVLSQPLEASLVPHTTEPTTKEGTQRVSAKEQLYKLCGVRHWKPPMYECRNEDGSCNMRLFIVKTTIEIKEDSRITVLEYFGDPHNKKKIAAEQAELWYLKNVGHTLQTDKASGR